MRIAVSGTHCTGKSTLIDEFLRAHKDFTHEAEPYMVLVEDFGEEFSDEPCVEDFFRQLEFNSDRLRQYAPRDRVIFERSPLDFLAYIDALDSESVAAAVGPVSDAIQFLDLIVYVPLDDSIEAPEAEFPKLRRAVDRRLCALFTNDEFGLISSSRAVVVEATGSIAQRLRIVEDAMKSIDA